MDRGFTLPELTPDPSRDERWMRHALDLARKAETQGEVPIGAVIVRNQVVIGEGYNRREMDNDPTAHAELLAIQEAARTLRSWRLVDCTLYVTLEPCIQCCGAILLSRLPRIVYGADDPKAGAVRSLYNLLEDTRLNHRADWEGGVLAAECGSILTDFFRNLRGNRSGI
jgi:tRNA(adenine34) deaminase